MSRSETRRNWVANAGSPNAARASSAEAITTHVGGATSMAMVRVSARMFVAAPIIWFMASHTAESSISLSSPVLIGSSRPIMIVASCAGLCGREHEEVGAVDARDVRDLDRHAAGS